MVSHWMMAANKCRRRPSPRDRRGVGAVTVLVLAGALAAAEARPSPSISYQLLTVEGVKANLVSVNLTDRRVRVGVGVARGFPARAEGWSSFLARSRPAAAINGTYFDLRTLRPVGDLVIAGQQVNAGTHGHAVTVDQAGRVRFMAQRSGADRWGGCETVLCAGPRLVSAGRVCLSPRAEGFSDSRLLGAARRSALGLTTQGRLLLVTVHQPITLSRLARILRALGAQEALNLDGGSSSGLYWGGRTITQPGRKLTNWLVVHDTPEAAARALGELAPAWHQAARRTAARAPGGPGAQQGRLYIWLKPGEVVRGEVEVRASVRPEEKTAFVVFGVDGAQRAATNRPPFCYRWDSRADADGEHELRVRALDAAGRALASHAVRVRVANGVPALPATGALPAGDGLARP